MQLQLNLFRTCLLFFFFLIAEIGYSFAPSSIGDFVWYDSNNNGIQDPGEPTLNGVRVLLYQQTSPGVFTVIGQTTTNASGVYRFDGTNSIPLLNNTTYYLVIPDPILQPGSFNPTTVTLKDAGPVSINQDNLDSDASIALAPFPFAGKAYIPFTTTVGTAPVTNYDFGFFTLCSEFNVVLNLVDEVCQGETIRLIANATGGQGTLGYDWNDDFSSSNNFHDVKPSVNTRYVVTVTDGVGCTATDFVDTRVRRCKLDMALKMTIRQDTAYKVNDIATFEIMACNQGETIVDSIIIRDHIPKGYVLADPDWIINSSTSTFTTVSYLLTEANGRLAGNLLPGECVTVPIDLRLVIGANRHNLVNYAEIYVQRDIYGFEDDFDSSPGSNSSLELSVKPYDLNDDNLLTNGPSVNEDQDDHDPAQAPFFDLALKKVSVSGKGPFKYDENVTYNVIVYNQGNVTASDIVVSDYVPSGFTFQPTNSPPWTFDGTSSIATTTVTGNLIPGDSIILPLVLKVKPTTNINGWLNNAEIFSAEDKFGDNRTQFDADSRPDNILGNDVGGLPNTDLDNLVTDDGLDSDGDGLRDEDDHDPEWVGVFDLALKKTLLTTSPFAYGQDLIFQIMICNQGNIVAKNVQITDYIPAGYEYMASANAPLGWVLSSPNVSNISMTQIAPGQCETRTIVLKLKSGLGLTNWDNYAEITRAEDNNGVNLTNFDADSTPGSNSLTENQVRPGSPNDDNLNGRGVAYSEDEDDHDPAAPNIVDIALRKTTTSTAPYIYGQIISFNIDVINQGNIPLNDITIVDYIPCGFEYVGGSQVWSVGGGQGTTVLVGILAPGQTKTIRIDIRLKACSSPNAWLSFAEVRGFEDINGNDISNQDIDSTPDNILGNDKGGLADSPNDDFIDGDGKYGVGLPLDTRTASDEDDHDPELIPIFDLALKKELLSPAPYRDGQIVRFDITVYNQGNITASNYVINDYIPIGYTYNPTLNTGWTGTGNTPLTVTRLVTTPLAPNTSATFSIFLNIEMTMGGSTNWINYAEIGSADNDNNIATSAPTDADSYPNSNTAQENTVIPGSIDDDNINGGGPNIARDEDDHDPAGPLLYDVALKMTTSEVGPFSIGQMVKFDIRVFNQGNYPIKNLEIVDYIPEGFAFLGVQNFPRWTYDVFSGYAIAKIKQTLLPGQSAEISIFLRVQYSTNFVTGWDNKAEIYAFEDASGNDVTYMDIDSSPDGIPGNDSGGEPEGPTDDYTNGDGSGPINGGPATGDEDDADPERIEIFDLALKKELVTVAPYKYGQKLTFNIKVCNQGNIGATNIDVRDYIPIGFSFSLADNPTWTAWPTYTITSVVQPNTCFDIPLVLTLVQTSGGENDWVNYAQITGADNKDGQNRDTWDIDSNPNSSNTAELSVKPGNVADNFIDGHDKGGEEDDHDPAGPKIFDLALRKIQVTASSSFSYGQNVVFGIQLYNQGNLDAKDIVLIDTLPCGLEYLPSSATNAAAGWVYNAATREIRTTYRNVLTPGANAQMMVEVKVIPCYINTDKAWTNFVEIEGANDTDPNTSNLPVDVDSNADGTMSNDLGAAPNSLTDNEINGDPNNPLNPNALQDEDDHDAHKIQVYDLALRKTVDFKGPYRIGETATFRIKIFNQGNVPVKNINVNDYIRSGFTFNAVTNPGWTLSATPSSSVDGLLNYIIPTTLKPGDSITVALNLVITLDANPMVKDWWNYAEIRFAQDTLGNTRIDDADSTPNSNNAYEKAVEPEGLWDNVTRGNGINFSQDEDDHDPEKVIVVGGLGDMVWKDLDGDGIQDIGEPGVQGVLATLTDCRGNVIQTTTTDAAGFYFFNNLIPGNYQVQFNISNLPRGCAFTFQNQGPNDRLDSDVNLDGLGPCTNIAGGEYDSSYDAGLLILAAIGDFVWHDINGDGQQSIGEPGIAGVKVNLYKGGGSFVGTTYTNTNGYYLFDFLYPGNYYLEFMGPSGFELTFQNRGNDATDSDINVNDVPPVTPTTYLAPNERDMTWDAGYYKCIPIGDLVWYDINKNDVWDVNENGINGLNVNLWRNHFGTWMIWKDTFTGHKPNTPSDDGYWKFCAPPGEYYVEVIMPPLGLVRARANVGAIEENDSDITNANGPTTTQKFTVLSGQEKCDLGAGFYPQATAGNLVWVDANANGVQETQEARMSGVLVQAVMLSSKEVVQSTITDSDGTYKIEGLEKQQYYLKFTPPAGYYATVPRAAADHMDSDVDHSYGANTTRVFEMQPASAYENIDMGLSFTPLPVDWMDVTATRISNTHRLEWTVARESNVSHYEVERRFGSEKEFYTIPGKVLAKGNTHEVTAYNLTDLDVDKSGIYVYRVKQYDFDGKSSYSKLVKVNHNGENAVELYPNPAKNETNVQIVVAQDAVASIEMFDAASKLVKVIKASDVQAAGDMIYNVNLQDVPAGIYNVVITVDGVQTYKKLIRIE